MWSARRALPPPNAHAKRQSVHNSPQQMRVNRITYSCTHARPCSDVGALLARLAQRFQLVFTGGMNPGWHSTQIRPESQHRQTHSSLRELVTLNQVLVRASECAGARVCRMLLARPRGTIYGRWSGAAAAARIIGAYSHNKSAGLLWSVRVRMHISGDDAHQIWMECAVYYKSIADVLTVYLRQFGDSGVPVRAMGRNLSATKRVH